MKGPLQAGPSGFRKTKDGSRRHLGWLHVASLHVMLQSVACLPTPASYITRSAWPASLEMDMSGPMVWRRMRLLLLIPYYVSRVFVFIAKPPAMLDNQISCKPSPTKYINISNPYQSHRYQVLTKPNCIKILFHMNSSGGWGNLFPKKLRREALQTHKSWEFISQMCKTAEDMA